MREVSERDYGVDAYIEIATSAGDVTGNLVSIQLKGTDKIELKDNEGGGKIARSPPIKTTTANYWLNLPVPVFLFVADLSCEKIYYASVEEGIRNQFEKLSKQQTITFKLLDQLTINSERGIDLFNWFVARERAYPQFTFHIANLLSHVQSFGEFIVENQNRDCFMEVESERHLQLRALYESCQMASLYLCNEWKIKSLGDLYVQDQEQWKDDFVYLHEGTLDNVLQSLESIFPILVRKAVKLISDTQGSYWRSRDLVFYSLCSNGDLEWSLKALEQRIATY